MSGMWEENLPREVEGYARVGGSQVILIILSESEVGQLNLSSGVKMRFL